MINILIKQSGKHWETKGNYRRSKSRGSVHPFFLLFRVIDVNISFLFIFFPWPPIGCPEWASFSPFYGRTHIGLQRRLQEYSARRHGEERLVRRLGRHPAVETMCWSTTNIYIYIYILYIYMGSPENEVAPIPMVRHHFPHENLLFGHMHQF